MKNLLRVYRELTYFITKPSLGFCFNHFCLVPLGDDAKMSCMSGLMRKGGISVDESHDGFMQWPRSNQYDCVGNVIDISIGGLI